ncbi:MAG TPA: FHA domain-containing protein, partial [Tepidisphaeraceae bacterium]
MATLPSSPATGAAEFSLIPQGDFAGKPPIRIVKPVVLVGSDEHCHLHLKSSTISRHHALIIRDDDRIYVCDLGSRTKILVNGKEQRDAELANGDKVQIGKFLFKFSASRSAAKKAKRAGPFRLIVDGQVVPTPPGARLILIGRTSGSDVMLVEESVSARHAAIFEVAGRRYVRDLDSRTGTFLNGKKQHQHEIRLGESLRVGETELKLAEAETAPAEAVLPIEAVPPVEATLPVADEEPLSLEPEPLPIADEAKSAPAPEEEPIPLALEPAEPTQAASEPAAAPGPAAGAVEFPLDDPLPFAEPMPLELEPEPSAHVEAESVPEPITAGKSRPEEPLELEPEFPPQEETDVARTPALEAAHSDDGVPLKFEPEAMSTEEETALAALAPSGDANEDTHIDLEPPLAAAEQEPEPVATPEPIVQATISADVHEPSPEIEPAEAIDLADAPEPEALHEPETIPVPVAAEPEPIEPPIPVVEATVPADVSEPQSGAEPEQTPEETIDLSDAPEAESPKEIETVAPPLAIEPEPIELVAPVVQATPIVQATIPADVAETPSEAEPAEAIDLSDAPESESPPDAPAISALDLLAELSANPREEFKHVDFDADPLPETPEPASVHAAEAIDVSEAPSVSEVESEPIPVPELAEPMPAPTAPTLNLDDAPEIQNSEPEQATETEPVEEPIASSATINIADAPSLVEPEPEPEAAEQTATASQEAIDLSDAPSLLEIEPEPMHEAQPAEPVAADSAATINLSDAPSLLEIEPEPASDAIEQTATASAGAVDLSDAPVIPDVEPEPSSPPAQEFSITDSSKTVVFDVEAAPAEPERTQTPINFDPAPTVEEVVPTSLPEAGETIVAPDAVQSAEDSISSVADAVIEAPPEPEAQKISRGRKRSAPAEPKAPKVRKSRAKRVPPKTADEEIAETVEAAASAAMETPIIESPAIEVSPVESSVVEPTIVEPTIAEPTVVEPAVIESTVVESTVAESSDVEPSVVEPPAVEVPELAADLSLEPASDSSLSVSEPISTDVTLTASPDAIPSDETAVAETPPDESSAAVPLEEPPIAP